MVALGDDGESPSAVATSTSAAVEAALDPCLVGRWRLATGTNGFEDRQRDIYLTSGGGGTLRSVEADGTERFDFSESAPYTGTAAAAGRR